MYPLSLVPSIIPAKRFHCAGQVRFLAWLGQVYLIAMEREVFYILWYIIYTLLPTNISRKNRPFQVRTAVCTIVWDGGPLARRVHPIPIQCTMGKYHCYIHCPLYIHYIPTIIDHTAIIAYHHLHLRGFDQTNYPQHHRLRRGEQRGADATGWSVGRLVPWLPWPWWLVRT